MKRIFLISTLLFLSGWVMAATQDSKAKEILDKVSQTNRSYKTIQIDFSFNLYNPKTKTTETNAGWVALKGQSYRLHMPALGMDVYSDGKTTWSYLSSSNEVNISQADNESDAALSPANLFTIYEKGFKNTYVGEENVSGKPAYVIDLVPEKTKDFTKVRLFIDKGSYEIVKAISYNKDGNIYTLTLKNMKTNQALPTDFFQFNPAQHPKVQINDMR